jgi:tetratricopeptide (TPR) repeat protein
MSLLLEALKKAEKAKDEAQRRAKDGGGGETPFDPDSTAIDPTKHVTTRAELPDISAPLEILSEDFSSQKKAQPEITLALEDSPPPAPERRPPPRRESARAAPEASAADRASAQKVFEAKFKEPNPRLPFFITVGALSVFAVGTVGYFWYQLRPPPALVNANPPRPSSEAPVAVAESRPVAGLPTAESQPASAIPGLPGTAPATPVAAPAAPVAAAPAPAPAPAPAAVPVAAAPAPAASQRAPRPAAAPRAPAKSAEESALTINRAGPQINPGVAAGYAAYQEGDLAKARNDYEQALRNDPSNRDAMLGLAAVEMRMQRFEQADAIYQRLLHANPRDPHAQAGMLALRSQVVDPVQAESRIKSLLASDPEASVLNFTLGNQYAQQGRWAEAQQVYFKAYAADPENPDYAFNLAVSLDQQRQPALALEYYRRALALAEKRASNFSREAARNRAQQLAR